MIVGFDIVNSPICVLVGEVACRKLVEANLCDLASESSRSLYEEKSPPPFPTSEISSSLHNYWDHKPDVVGKIPRLVKAVVFLTPWPNIVDHKHME